jgi:hypothetical protein
VGETTNHVGQMTYLSSKVPDCDLGVNFGELFTDSILSHTGDVCKGLKEFKAHKALLAGES